MPHVSPREVDKKFLDKIYLNLSKIFSKITSENDANILIGSLLTRTEKLMLGKRLTVIWLVHKGLTYNEIESNLKMSSATVYRISVGYEVGKYDDLIKILENNRSFLFDELHHALHLGGRLRAYGVSKRSQKNFRKRQG